METGLLLSDVFIEQNVFAIVLEVNGNYTLHNASSVNPRSLSIGLQIPKGDVSYSLLESSIAVNSSTSKVVNLKMVSNIVNNFNYIDSFKLSTFGVFYKTATSTTYDNIEFLQDLPIELYLLRSYGNMTVNVNAKISAYRFNI